MIFSVLMIASFVQVLVESVQRLFAPNPSPAELPIPAVGVMIGTIVVKGVVWLWCRRKQNSSVRALAQDAENDTVFNFFSLLFPFLGQRLRLGWFDAVGGIALSTYSASPPCSERRRADATQSSTNGWRRSSTTCAT